MAQKRGADRSGDNNKVTRSLVEREVSLWLPRLMYNRALPLIKQPKIQVTPSPLTVYIQRQINRFRESSSQLARWVTEHLSLTPTHMAHLPILKPAFLSQVGQRPIDLVWFREHQKRETVSPQVANYKEERLLNPTNLRGDEPHSNESAQTAYTNYEQVGVGEEAYPEVTRSPTLPPTTRINISRAVDDFFHSENAAKVQGGVVNEAYPQVIKRLTLPSTTRTNISRAVDDFFHSENAAKAQGGVVNEAYPQVIKSLPSPPTNKMESSSVAEGYFHSDYVTSEHIPAKPQAEEFQTVITSKSTLPNVSPIGFNHGDRIQKHKHQPVKGEGTWRPQHIYQNRWLEKIRAPFIQRLWLNRVPSTALSYNTRQPIHLAHITSVRHWPYQPAIEGVPEPDNKTAQPNTLSNITDVPEVTTPSEKSIHGVDNYNHLVTSDEEPKLRYYLPHWREAAVPGTILNRPSPSNIITAARSLKKLVFKSLSPKPLIPSKDPDSLATGVAFQQTPEISQFRRSMPLVSRKIADWRADATNAPANTRSIISSRGTVTAATPDNTSFSQRWQTNQAEPPSPRRVSSSAAELYYQPPHVIENIYQMPTLPSGQYHKSAHNIRQSAKTESYGFLYKQSNESSSRGYKDTHQSVLEQHANAVEARADSIANSVQLLPVSLERNVYHASLPTPEMVLTPVSRAKAETSIQRTETEVKDSVTEATAPDIDAIARSVYSILKRRLARERERASGLS